MTTIEAAENTAAEALLRVLHDHGIDYLFANPGTDFPPVIEAFAANAETNALPRPILVPHENAAVAMAHGVYLVTGKPQAAMVHVTVGTANTVNAMMDASRDFIPLLLLAGRSPITEHGPHGTRNAHIHWAQEMFDQAGMLRELVKWDYELRMPDQVPEVVERAVEVAMTQPRGPIYLSLPREVLAEPARKREAARPRRAVPDTAFPNPASIGQVTEWLAHAERPLLITSGLGRDPEAVTALASLAERFAIGVTSPNARYMNLPSSHPMHLGYQSGPLLPEADLVLVVDCDVPWIPSVTAPPERCRVVHIGDDPIFHRYPMRSFPSDLSIAASPAVALAAIEEALEARGPGDEALTERRRAFFTRFRDEQQREWSAQIEKARGGNAISPEWISRCIADAAGEDSVIVNEYPLRNEYCPREQAGSYFALSPAGGLGWSVPAALGVKLAAPDKLVVAVAGDGAYMFANPTACHWASAAHRLPILTVVFNNERYGAVRLATLGMYADGIANERNSFLADLGAGGTAYEKIVEANGGLGLRAERPDELPAVLERAVRAVKTEGRQVLVNVIARY